MKIKSILYNSLICGTLVISSCSADEPSAPTPEKVNVSVNVDVENLDMTRSTSLDSSKGGVQNLGEAGLNYIFGLYEVGENDSLTLTEFSQITDAEGDGERFSPLVTLGKTYKMVVYAYFGDALPITDAQKQSWLENIEIKDQINTEAEDTYFGSAVKKFTINDLEQSITIRRPYAKLRIVATDWNTSWGTIESVTVNYGANNIMTKFNALTGVFDQSGETNVVITGDEYSTSDSATEKTIVADYLPVNVNELTLSEFTVTVKYNGDQTITRTFSSVPLKRNALTTLKGAFFTSSSTMKASFGAGDIGS